MRLEQGAATICFRNKGTTICFMFLHLSHMDTHPMARAAGSVLNGLRDLSFRTKTWHTTAKREQGKDCEVGIDGGGVELLPCALTTTPHASPPAFDWRCHLQASSAAAERTARRLNPPRIGFGENRGRRVELMRSHPERCRPLTCRRRNAPPGRMRGMGALVDEQKLVRSDFPATGL